ncbi:MULTISPECIES: hypothetical protein [Mycobacterium]|uniref:hypothetical protein n=1 Tax=Mycobacterium TaxID=1763 RepID=UPI0007A096F3|nr:MULTISPECIES: hypothetical protein [Mycobacterium]MCV7100905.1 hypothetical protein [Mycobacterium palustre]MDV3215720.1 hypothetical protein [Mycobacterium avium]
MTDFDYQPQAGVVIAWVLRVSGYHPDVDGQVDAQTRTLSDVEFEIESMVDEYQAETGASITRIHGSHGWRIVEWDTGAVHRYEWEHTPIDLRCAICLRPEIADLYMVTDELWASSGLDGWVCFRCLEAAIGRRLVAADFKGDCPANTDTTQHCRELRQRMGLA